MLTARLRGSFASLLRQSRPTPGKRRGSRGVASTPRERSLLAWAWLGLMVAGCGPAQVSTPTARSATSPAASVVSPSWTPSVVSPTPSPPEASVDVLVSTAKAVYFAHGSELGTCDQDFQTGRRSYARCPLTPELLSHYQAVAPSGCMKGTGGYCLLCHCQSPPGAPLSYRATSSGGGGTASVDMPNDVSGDPPDIFTLTIALSSSGVLVSNITLTAYDIFNHVYCRPVELDQTAC